MSSLRTQRKPRAASSGTRRKPLHRKAPAGASEPASTMVEGITPPRRKADHQCEVYSPSKLGSMEQGGGSTNFNRSSHGPRRPLNDKERYAKNWNSVLHSAAEHLPYRTRGVLSRTISNFLISSANCDHPRNRQTKPPKGGSCPRRTAALANALDLLDSEEFFQLYSLRVAKQRYAQWPED